MILFAKDEAMVKPREGRASAPVVGGFKAEGVTASGRGDRISRDRQ